MHDGELLKWLVVGCWFGSPWGHESLVSFASVQSLSHCAVPSPPSPVPSLPTIHHLLQYTVAPEDVADLVGQRACFGFDLSADLAGVMEDPGAEITDDQILIGDCTATLSGEACRCEVCDDGAGIDLDCGDGLISEGCTDFEMAAATGELTSTLGSDGGGGSSSAAADGGSGSTVSVVRFAREQESSPGTRAGPAGAAAAAGAATVAALAASSFLL